MSSRLEPGRVSRSKASKPTSRATAVIDSGARASESVASSTVSRALTVAVADVCAEWPHTEHGATSAADVRTTVGIVVGVFGQEGVIKSRHGHVVVFAHTW